MKRDTKNLLALVGVAGLLSGGTAAAAETLFQVNDVTPDHWTQIAGKRKDKKKDEKKDEAKGDEKGAEAACGEGKCGEKAEGSDKGAEASCGAEKKAEGSEKGAEHSCGAGKCG